MISGGVGFCKAHLAYVKYASLVKSKAALPYEKITSPSDKELV